MSVEGAQLAGSCLAVDLRTLEIVRCKEIDAYLGLDMVEVHAKFF